ncbi:two-component sensor histidine kinase [Gordonia spumicola]|uniref:histidine kinase n=2 Tax=Gordonia spumicola TaxID=589161 RepID=A0A7I9VEK3_9ACTN|nr:two-component sensor histidine kinase [Gordonia spumicola]
MVADVAVGLVMLGVVVRYRRTHPVIVATVTNVAGVFSACAAGPAALALVSLSTRRRWRELIPQSVVTIVCSVAGLYVLKSPSDEPIGVADFGFLFVALGLAVAWGLYMGSRRELLASWQLRARLAEGEQHARVREAQVAERTRIAREMHDVLAHRISTIGMHAGALAFRDDLPPEQIRETAQTIQETSHLALTELREVLGVLREGPGDADPEPPQATVDDIHELIEENRRSGMRIDVDCDADLAELPDVLGRTLYRCVQEALTNARKHAPASRVRIAMSGGVGDGLDLLVVNPLSVAATAAPESGFGLVGLAERVALHGGRQSARTVDRAFELRVWLPWQA